MQLIQKKLLKPLGNEPQNSLLPSVNLLHRVQSRVITDLNFFSIYRTINYPQWPSEKKNYFESTSKLAFQFSLLRASTFLWLAAAGMQRFNYPISKKNCPKKCFKVASDAHTLDRVQAWVNWRIFLEIDLQWPSFTGS